MQCKFHHDVYLGRLPRLRYQGVPLPLTAGVMELMQALRVDGRQGNDHGGLIQYYEKTAQVEVQRQG